MATLNWLARALARSQVSTFTPGGTIEIGDIFIITINSKAVSYSATGTTVASVCTGMAAALQASEIPEFLEVTWADGTTTITGTGTAGVPFTATASTTESNGGAADTQTFVAATGTTATGPNHWDNVLNWDTGAAPANGDTANVNLDLGSVLHGLDASAVTLARLNITSTGPTQNTTGLPKINANGYTEYREQSLKISYTDFRYDCESPLGRFNCGSVQAAIEVLRTGQSTNPPQPALLLTGTNSANTVDVTGGTVGLGYYDGEVFNAASVTNGANGSVVTGTGSTIADTVTTGSYLSQGVGTNFQTENGTAEIRGTPGFSTLVCSGGTTLAHFGGTIADVLVGPGTLDASADNTPRTFTNCSFDVGGNVNDPNETITYGNISKEAGVSQLSAT